jgi:hypothetical protein
VTNVGLEPTTSCLLTVSKDNNLRRQVRYPITPAGQVMDTKKIEHFIKHLGVPYEQMDSLALRSTHAISKRLRGSARICSDLLGSANLYEHPIPPLHCPQPSTHRYICGDSWCGRKFDAQIFTASISASLSWLAPWQQ